MKKMEDIFNEHLKCKKPFLKHPYYEENGYCRFPVTMTRNGSKAYGNLISLLYDIGKITEIDVNDIVDRLDSVVSEI